MIDGVSKFDTWVGVTVGFAVGLLLVFGLEPVIDMIAGEDDHDEITKGVENSESPTYKQIKMKVEELNKDGPDAEAIITLPRKKSHDDDDGEYDEAPVEAAMVSMKLPEHRQHLNEHLTELVDFINSMEKNCEKLLDPTVTHRESEDIAEEIDEATHKLQYKVDHCRRLVILRRETQKAIYILRNIS